MGVMACDRRGCRNVMCDRMILRGSRDDSRYICDSCYDELLVYKGTWNCTRIGEVSARIEAFMGTEPGTYLKAGAEDINSEFERLTGARDE